MEQTLLSVLQQGYPNLEYVVADGGSTDDTPKILQRYGPRLASWCSRKDQGQYDAINQGFAKTTGEIMGWLNSDDLHMPWTLHVVAEIFGRFPQLEWVTTLFPICLDANGQAINCRPVAGYTRSAFLRGANLPGGHWHAEEHIQQEGTFWRRCLWDRCGGRVDTSYRHAGDFELWARFFAEGARLHGVSVPLGGFRVHEQQKTALVMSEYFQECQRALLQNGGAPYGRWTTFCLRKWGKLARWVEKRYARRLAGGDRYINLHRFRGDWRLEEGP